MTEKALITGITGQDGSYLTEFLLAKGYEVHGIIRRASTFNTRRLDHIYRDPHNGDQVRLYLHYGDIGSSGNLLDIIRDVQPDEIYHPAAQSRVQVSFDLPDVEDAAEAILLAAERYDQSEPVNPSTRLRTSIGSAFETSPKRTRGIGIKDLLETIARLTGFESRVSWDTLKPNGQPRRELDVSRARGRFGFQGRSSFEGGISFYAG